MELTLTRTSDSHVTVTRDGASSHAFDLHTLMPDETIPGHLLLVTTDDAIGQPQRALALYEETLPILRAVGNRAGEAATLANLAVLLYQQLNRAPDGIRRMVEAITVLEHTGLSRDASGATVEQRQAALAAMRAGKPLR